jgi:hypothetical protein
MRRNSPQKPSRPSCGGIRRLPRATAAGMPPTVLDDVSGRLANKKNRPARRRQGPGDMTSLGADGAKRGTQS